MLLSRGQNVIRRAAFPNDLTLNAQRQQLIHPVQSIINFVAVVTETSTLFNFLITLEMAFFIKE